METETSLLALGKVTQWKSRLQELERRRAERKKNYEHYLVYVSTIFLFALLYVLFVSDGNRHPDS